MPYEDVNDLPESVRKNLPQHAQEIYLASYNNAFEQYQDPEKRRGDATLEEVAHRVAWAAVKQEHRKNRQTGKWERK